MIKRVSAHIPIALILAGVIINVAIGQLVRNVFELPFYLDSIGTILAGALGGPLFGAITGALSNVIWGFAFDDTGIIPYAITAACIGGVAGIASSLGAFTNPLKSTLAGLITGVIAALVSAPITADLLEGDSGGGAGAVQERLWETGRVPSRSRRSRGLSPTPSTRLSPS